MEAVPCQHCGEPTVMHGTKLCDDCWEIRKRFPDYLRRITNEQLAFIAHMVEQVREGRGEQ